MYVRAGRPAFARPYVGVHRSTSLMSSSLLLQQCPVCLTWIVFVIRRRWPYSWCLVGCSARTCSVLLAAFLCNCRQASFPAVNKMFKAFQLRYFSKQFNWGVINRNVRSLHFPGFFDRLTDDRISYDAEHSLWLLTDCYFDIFRSDLPIFWFRYIHVHILIFISNPRDLITAFNSCCLNKYENCSKSLKSSHRNKNNS